MEITLPQHRMHTALGLAQRVVPRRSTLPVLSCILIRTDGETITVGASDIERSFVSTFPCRGLAGSVEAAAVPGMTFTKMVSSLHASTLTLKANGSNELTLEAGGTHANFKLWPAEEFPILPDHVQEGTEINAEALTAALRRVLFAASEDENHPILTGVHVVSTGTSLRLEAADGFRASIHELAWEGKAFDVIAPAKALGLLQYIEADTYHIGGNEGDRLRITCRDAQARSAVTVSSQLISGSFPDVRRIVPPSHKLRAVLDQALLKSAVKQAMIFATKASNIVHLTVADGELIVEARDGETGGNQARLPLEDLNGYTAPFQFGVNGRYLLDAIGAASDLVALGLNGPHTPILIEQPSEERWTHVLMPMHLAGHRE